MGEPNQMSDDAFDAILGELKTLHDQKRYQYANESDPMKNFRRTAALVRPLLENPLPVEYHPLAVAMILNAKQIVATYDIIGEGKTNTVEAVEDKFKDTSIYAIIAMILHREIVPCGNCSST